MRSQKEFKKVLAIYIQIQEDLNQVQRDPLVLEDQVDYDLLDAYLKTQIFYLGKIKD